MKCMYSGELLTFKYVLTIQAQKATTAKLTLSPHDPVILDSMSTSKNTCMGVTGSPESQQYN